MTRAGRRIFTPKEKNYVQVSGAVLAAGVDNTQELAVCDDGTASYSIAKPSRIKAIYLEFRVEQTAARSARLSWILIKDPNAGLGITPSNIEASGGENAFIIRAGQMNIAVNGGYAFSGWIMIPKRHQTFNENDRLRIILNDAAAGELCLLCTYKWES